MPHSESHSQELTISKELVKHAKKVSGSRVRILKTIKEEDTDITDTISNA